MAEELLLQLDKLLTVWTEALSDLKHLFDTLLDGFRSLDVRFRGTAVVEKVDFDICGDKRLL